MNRRRFLKIIPAGLLSSFLPAKLLGSEKNAQKEKNKTLEYQVDGIDIEQTTFYHKNMISQNKHNFDFMAVSKSGKQIPVALYFYDKKGNMFRARYDCFWPDNAVFPKNKWMNKIILKTIKVMKEHLSPRRDVKKIYVYIFLRADRPCFGLLLDDEPWTNPLEKI